jgi:hypothetical protein
MVSLVYIFLEVSSLQSFLRAIMVNSPPKLILVLLSGWSDEASRLVFRAPNAHQVWRFLAFIDQAELTHFVDGLVSLGSSPGNGAVVDSFVAGVVTLNPNGIVLYTIDHFALVLTHLLGLDWIGGQALIWLVRNLQLYCIYVAILVLIRLHSQWIGRWHEKAVRIFVELQFVLVICHSTGNEEVWVGWEIDFCWVHSLDARIACWVTLICTLNCAQGPISIWFIEFLQFCLVEGHAAALTALLFWILDYAVFDWLWRVFVVLLISCLVLQGTAGEATEEASSLPAALFLRDLSRVCCCRHLI